MSNKEKISIQKVLIKKKKIPVLRETSLLKEALECMSKYKYGVCFCVNEKGKLLGILTDGDVRRKILDVQKPFSALLMDDLILHINKKPFSIDVNKNINNALKIMKYNQIWDLPVVDSKKNLIGMLHLHPIIKFLIKK